jgi:hypothetical protein
MHSSGSQVRLGLPVGLLKNKTQKLAVHVGGRERVRRLPVPVRARRFGTEAALPARIPRGLYRQVAAEKDIRCLCCRVDVCKDLCAGAVIVAMGLHACIRTYQSQS